MNKRLALERAFREVAFHCARDGHRGAIGSIHSDELRQGQFKLESLEITVYPDAEVWVLDVVATKSGKLVEMSESGMADLVDHESVLIAANAANANNPIIAGIQTQLSRAAREESGRLADALLALMDDKS